MLLYFLVRWCYIFGETGVLRWYLTDLLFVPAMCTFGLIVVRLVRRDSHAVLSWWHVYVQVIMVAFYFEWYLPSHYSQYTSDLWDVVMYALGGTIYLFVQKYL